MSEKSQLPKVKLSLACAQFAGLTQVNLVLVDDTMRMIGLRYRRGVDDAPIVQKRLSGFEAKKFIRLAQAKRVKVIQAQKFVGRAFSTLAVGDEIEESDYKELAAYLARSYRKPDKEKTEDWYSWMKHVGKDHHVIQFYSKYDLDDSHLFMMPQSDSGVLSPNQIKTFQTNAPMEVLYPDHLQVHPKLLNEISKDGFSALIKEQLDLWYSLRGFPIVLAGVPNPGMHENQVHLFLKGMKISEFEYSEDDESSKRFEFVRDLNRTFVARSEDFFTRASLNKILDQISIVDPGLIDDLERHYPDRFNYTLRVLKTVVSEYGRIVAPQQIIELIVEALSEKLELSSLIPLVRKAISIHILQSVQNRSLVEEVGVLCLAADKETELLSRLDKNQTLFTHDEFWGFAGQLENAKDHLIELGQIPVLVVADTLYDQAFASLKKAFSAPIIPCSGLSENPNNFVEYYCAAQVDFWLDIKL